MNRPPLNEIEQASLDKWKAELATVWDQHEGERTWVANLKPGAYVWIEGQRKEQFHPTRMIGRVVSNMPSFEFVIVRPLDVYSPNMVGASLCFLYNGKAGRKSLEKFEFLNIERYDKLGLPMDGYCGSEGLVE